MAPCCKDLYTIPARWKHPSSCMASILTGHVIHWACLGCSGSAYTTVRSSLCQYPAILHSHWRGVDQHSTGHNQQPEQLYAKEMCCTVWGKWWSHQILTGFLTPPGLPNKAKLHISEWPFIVASLRHTCAIIMPSNGYGKWAGSPPESCVSHKVSFNLSVCMLT